ncbi:MAG: glycosyltransferase family 4 protein [Flavobacterium sp.]|uniref:glycosyltransferase family 4 protein n=1 Tax=Flavobacterium sp. Leaf359 TaxID=1736351 RepID=UPI0006F6011D|nr:glycosyltransferase family 1 protein [Flavobacterium sp. Leaf359]KQS52738.1 hypothetical protein ASG38_16545 [Flavobacterium sp. Leaf359]MBU7571624.1 glycosyltransferase family 4 protein [Flavobacterium sp.]PZO33445.1 MAG: glycosyltransferase family 1 protein [Flavobacteriaceae bacterium]
MKKLNIFVDSHVFDDGFQGTTTYLKGLYQELIKNSDKHFFFAAKNIKNLQDIFGLQDNITYLKYASGNKFYRLMIDIPKLVKKHKIDYAHFQYIVPPIKRCKYIVTVHDVLFIDFPDYFPFFNRVKNQFLFKVSAKISDVVLTVSEYSKKQIENHFGINNIHITTNAVSGEFFEAYKKEEIQKEILKKYNISNYLIYVSRWEPRKNHNLILKSFVDLGLYKKYSLVFIGEITFENKEYTTLLNTLDITIKEKIHSFENLKFIEMLKFLRGSQVSMYPSLAEGFGIPPLESVAAGIPTITSNATAMSDFDFLKEYSFNPLNQQEFEEKLLKTLREGDIKVEELRQYLKDKYSWEKSARNYNLALKA